MALFNLNWKAVCIVWGLIEPFVRKLLEQQVPQKITKLYENLAKYAQPAVDSLFKLKTKIDTTPNEVDNYCFTQGVDAIEAFANYLLAQVQSLRA